MGTNTNDTVTMEWISVEDCLPEKGQRVIGFGEEVGVFSSIIHLNVDGVWKFSDSNAIVSFCDFITHWMPLPEPPKQ